MAIDTNVSETLKNHTRIKNVRRGGSPEPSCQLPTAPAHSSLIPLTQGKFAIVDDDKYEWLNQWKWFAHKSYRGIYYAYRTEQGIKIAMHRTLLNMKINDKREIDHRNRNGLDNRMINIRSCTHAQNIQNSHKLDQNYSSQYKGVYYDKGSKKWRVEISVNKKRYKLGRYKSEIEAAKAYDAKALELVGEFAYTNLSAHTPAADYERRKKCLRDTPQT